jgi:hypothetical protein
MSTPEPPSEREPLLADLPTRARPPRADRHGLRVTTPSSRRSTRLARPGPERDTTRRDETMQRGRTEVVLRSVGGTRQVAQCRTVRRRQLVELLPEQHLGLVRLAWRRRDVSELGHGRLKPPRGGAARPMGRRRQQRNAPGHRAGPVRRPPLRIRRLGVRVPPSAPHRPRSAAGWPATAGLKIEVLHLVLQQDRGDCRGRCPADPSPSRLGRPHRPLPRPHSSCTGTSRVGGGCGEVSGRLSAEPRRGGAAATAPTVMTDAPVMTVAPDAAGAA